MEIVTAVQSCLEGNESEVQALILDTIREIIQVSNLFIYLIEWLIYDNTVMCTVQAHFGCYIHFRHVRIKFSIIIYIFLIRAGMDLFDILSQHMLSPDCELPVAQVLNSFVLNSLLQLPGCYDICLYGWRFGTAKRNIFACNITI
jgi:hypothetical protein